MEHEAQSQRILYHAAQKLFVSANARCLFGVVLDDTLQAILHFCNVEPYPLVIYMEERNKALIQTACTVLANHFLENHIGIGGIVAQNEICQSFISQYKLKANISFLEKQGMDIMEIRKVNDIKLADGVCRTADVSEVKMITDWMIQFQMESAISEMDYEAALSKAASLIEEHRMYVFENPEHKIVSMAAAFRKLVHGIVISYIYTPEEFRGRGYAAANIYYLSKQFLEEGYQFCTLFVDKNNLLSGRAYEKVGYTIISESCEYQAVPAESMAAIS